MFRVASGIRNHLLVEELTTVLCNIGLLPLLCATTNYYPYSTYEMSVCVRKCLRNRRKQASFERRMKLIEKSSDSGKKKKEKTTVLVLAHYGRFICEKCYIL